MASLLAPSVLALSGCMASVHENHYFQSLDHQGNVQNYYRLSVSGKAVMSPARYTSGYFDEQAARLFFNETTPLSTISSENFSDSDNSYNHKSSDTPIHITSLNTKAEKDTFMLLLSTSTSDVMQAIEQIAENQMVADAVTNLAHRELLIQSLSANQFEENKIKASAKEIIHLFDELPEVKVSARQSIEKSYLDILNAIARFYGSTPSFTNLDQAKSWLQKAHQEGQK